jgi:type I restriction enzyme S subunit
MIPASKDVRERLCLRVANIQDWELDLRDEKFVDLDPSDVDRHSVVDGDMVLARAIATEEHLGKSVITYPGTKRWAFDSHLMRLRFNREKVVPEFVREALRTPGGRKLFLSVTRRSAVQYNINTKEIGSLRIPVPVLDLQMKYLERVQHIKDLRNAADSGLGSLNELFVSLQTRAFRGEL